MQNFKIRELSPSSSRERLGRSYGSVVDLFQSTIVLFFCLLCMFLVLSSVPTQTAVNASPASQIISRDENNDTSQNCTTQELLGAGPVPPRDDGVGFLTFSTIIQTAHSAPVPDGFVASLTLLSAALTGGGQITTEVLTAYNPSVCAGSCRAKTNCNTFNIYFERAPLYTPASDCTNPPSTTIIKCTFWEKSDISKLEINTGQQREKFDVVMAGSNIYTIDSSATSDTVVSHNSASLSPPNLHLVLGTTLLTGIIVLGEFGSARRGFRSDVGTE